MILPRALQPGDPIDVVAPSGPFDDGLLRVGIERLGDFSLRVPDDLWGRRFGFFAGDDETRLAELQRALDGDARAILVARGGYGIARILGRIDFERFTANPKWLIGFSDVTCLHAALTARGIASLHAPNATTLAGASDYEVRELLRLLSGSSPQPIDGLSAWSGGRASGTLFGGNLTVLFAEAAAGRLDVPDGAVLFLEDVTETSYRVDRMLTALEVGGHLARAAGVVLGDFHDCSPGKFSVPVADVLRDRLIPLGIPLAANLPVGHGARNLPLLCGRSVTLDADTGRLFSASLPG